MSGYDRELVELLVPTIWDRDFAWGMVDTRAPDKDMPKASKQKNHGNTLWAHLADVRVAWRHAQLTKRERQALVLCGGLDLNYVEAGHALGIHRRVAQATYERAVGRIVDYLNGTNISSYYDDEDA